MERLSGWEGGLPLQRGCPTGDPGLAPALLHSQENTVRTYFIELSYLLASVLFILGLKGMSHPETAKRGMHLAEFGMLMAIVGTLLHLEIITYTWIIIGLVLGSLVGLAMGVWVPMTAMPQRTALSHAFGAFAAALV